MNFNEDVFDSFHQLYSQGDLFTLVTVVEAKGSYPQKQGARMIVRKDSKNSPHIGTVGGGAIEAMAIKESLKLMNRFEEGGEKGQLCHYNLARDLKMTCGGEGQLLYEVFGPSEFKVIVFGAGHVSQALVSLLLKISCHITVIDKRPEWLELFPKDRNLKTIQVDNYEEAMDSLPENAFFISMTPGHLFDKEVLTALLKKKNPPYVGAIGSRSKAADLKRKLIENGVEGEKVDRIRCPIGLPFGGNTPYEVGYSIVGELLTERDNFFKVKKNKL